ncbi:MAG: phosphoglycerate kinase [Holosporales bacterium]
MRTLSGIELSGRRVLVRFDFNVPLHEGRILDDTRLRASLPTLHELLDRGARIIILAHLGRPKGPDAGLSLAPIAAALGEMLQRPIPLLAQPEEALHMGSSSLLMLENLRFWPGEEANDQGFAQTLARAGDLYVNDAFAVSHRAHASVAAITQCLPSCAGRLMEKELTALRETLEHPKRPLMAIVGGSKVSTKLELLENLIRQVDVLALGGGIANTFLLAQGKDMGASLVEASLVPQAHAILQAAQGRCQILLPEDVRVAPHLAQGQQARTCSVDGIGSDEMVLDWGPRTLAMWAEALTQVKSVIWNGPVGAFEYPPFDEASLMIAKTLARATTDGHIKTLAGGGETIAVLNQARVFDQFSYVSTAGGAFLEYLEGKLLSGVAALMEAKDKLSA